MTAHDYGCDCDQCAAMFQAIIAQTPDGEYFYTDAELLKLAEQGEKK